MKEEQLTTDLLIIGGGVAGLNAALTAARQGLDVIVMDKAVIERSGHIAGGIDHFMAFLETGPDWDTREAYLECTGRISKGAADVNVVDQVYCGNLKEAISRHEEIGVPLTREDGSYYRTQSYGQPGPWMINFDGKRLKPVLARAVRQAGCRVLDRVAAADLLIRDQQVCGAAGFHMREDSFYAVSAKAVILATGGTNRLFQNPTGRSFNTWMCPANTGDGEALAFRAGAALANIEYLRMTVVPRGFNAAGLNALVGMGARLINGRHEEFMDRYHPLGMKGPRFKLVEGVLGELKANRGPIYMDCTRLDPDDLAHLKTTLGLDKDTLPDYFEQMGIDIAHDLFEVYPSEGMQGGPNELTGSGIKIDRRCATTLPGLFAGGNSVDQCRSLHMAVTSGIHAARTASAFAAGMNSRLAPLAEQVSSIRRRIYAPMESDGDVHWHEFEDGLQRVITEGLGPARSAWGLEKTRRNLENLEKYFPRVRTRSGHDLVRLHELGSMLTVAKCMVCAAALRTESRFGLCHRRVDYPDQNDEQWQGQIVVTRGEDGGVSTRFAPLPETN